MPGWIGPWEIAILLIIALLIFGPKRLPEMGRSLGKGMREFKNSITSKHDLEDEDEDEPEPAAVTAASAEAPASPERERDSVSQ